jgi:hypothetical protein
MTDRGASNAAFDGSLDSLSRKDVPFSPLHRPSFDWVPGSGFDSLPQPVVVLTSPTFDGLGPNLVVLGLGPLDRPIGCISGGKTCLVLLGWASLKY